MLVKSEGNVLDKGRADGVRVSQGWDKDLG
jgi:hypothetical protein